MRERRDGDLGRLPSPMAALGLHQQHRRKSALRDPRWSGVDGVLAGRLVCSHRGSTGRLGRWTPGSRCPSAVGERVCVSCRPGPVDVEDRRMRRPVSRWESLECFAAACASVPARPVGRRRWRVRSLAAFVHRVSHPVARAHRRNRPGMAAIAKRLGVALAAAVRGGCLHIRGTPLGGGP
jgi:hypothetical protein